jgi:hypothetical protein
MQVYNDSQNHRKHTKILIKSLQMLSKNITGHTKKAYGGIGAELPVHNLDNRWKCFFSLLLMSIYLRVEHRCYPPNTGMVGSRAGLHDLEKKKVYSSGRDKRCSLHPRHYTDNAILDTIPTTLSRFHPHLQPM